MLKLINYYHLNAKSSLEYLKDRLPHLYFSVFTYSPLSKLIKYFPSLKYNIYADDIKIHADCHQSSNIHLQSFLNTINNYLTNNYLLLNPNEICIFTS